MYSVEKRGNLSILTITGDDDEHRLNPTLIISIRSSLTQIKSQFTQLKSPSSVLITTSIGKFFSNGYDLNWANSTINPQNSRIIMDSQLQSLIHDLITFPMPTIAAVTGHASAAGMILVMAHDYVVMRRERGFLYMSELDIGLVIPEWFMALVKCKVSYSKARRKVVLTEAKVTAEMGEEIGVVDEVGEGVGGTVEKAVKLGEKLVRRGWDGVVYGENRKVLFKEVLDLIEVKHVDGVEDGKIGVNSRF